jgi:hypothetical protein
MEENRLGALIFGLPYKCRGQMLVLRMCCVLQACRCGFTDVNGE